MSHKLKSVRALNDLILLAIFQDGTEKMYDIKQLFTVFPQLRELERSFDLFNGVQIDTGGYGVSWNDDLDLDAEEIWDNGINTEKKHLIDIKQSFATKLISAREICNITQRDLSKRAGITQGDISKIENGNANPSLSTLERLAEGLGMRIEFNFVGKWGGIVINNWDNKSRNDKDFVEKELADYVIKFSKEIDKNNAGQIAKDIIKLIDWDNSALMHKGLSWIAKNYLIQQNMI